MQTQVRKAYYRDDITTHAITIIIQEKKKKTNDMQCTQFHEEEEKKLNNLEGLEADGKRTWFPKDLFYASCHLPPESSISE